jgi:hypothetical protein
MSEIFCAVLRNYRPWDDSICLKRPIQWLKGIENLAQFVNNGRRLSTKKQREEQRNIKK